MALCSGALLGPYEILDPLGSGGMGEVYRARDTRLGRLVAIKVAHERFGERFQREARTIAKLNHPRICTLHDVGPNYLVMELIEGETLAARLRKGAVAPPQALKVAAQIAEGLAAAHAAGIVHRDLKPQNVMITRNGAKVLDFGIARGGDDETHTVTGGVIGTPAYMAPEQREGAIADERSDHYALGLMLLEMISGRRPDAIDPRIPDDIPPAVSRLIARCLARNPLDRWQSAGDPAAVLDQITPAHPGANAARGPALWMTSAAVLALIAAVIAAISWTRPTPAPAVIRLTIPPPEGTSFATVSQAGAPAVSPDGRMIAFVADGADGRRLWVRSLDTFDARPGPGTAGAAQPAWSPDSGSLTFFADGSLKRVDLDGQDAQVLTTNTIGAGAATWNDRGQIVWSAGNVLRVISAAGGEASAATDRDAALLEENHYGPSFLPDGTHYLVLVRGGPELQFQLCLGELGSPTSRRVLLSGVSAAKYAPPGLSGTDGSVLFVRDGQLLSRPFDPGRLAFTGEPRLVADRVASHSFGHIGDFAVSPAGVLAYRVAELPSQELAWFDRAGRRVGGIGDRPGNRRNNVRLSPDGKSVAFVRQEGDVQDVWTYDLASGAATRLTFNGGRSPVWSPDGSEVMFLHQDTIFRRPVAGAGVEVPVWKGSGILALNDWSGDGHHLLFTRWDTSQGMTGRGLWLLSLGGSGASPEPALFEAGALHGQFGPAAGAPRWIAYDSASGQSFVRNLPGAGSGKWQISVDGGNAVRWRPDGRELFFISGPSFMSVEVDGAAASGFRYGPPRRLFVAPPAIRVAMSQYALGYDVAADGQQFLATFPTLESPSSVINVVINWQAGLAR